MENKHTFTLLCIIRKSRMNRHGDYPVYLRITVDKKRTEIATKVIVPDAKWDTTKGRLKGASPDVKAINQMLNNFEHRAREIYNRLVLQGKLILPEEIKNEITGVQHKQQTLLATFYEYVLNLESRINSDYAVGTVKNWKVTQRHLSEFIRYKYSVKDIPFRQLNFKFITDLELFARTRWHCGTNATLKHIERIRKVVKMALHNGWLDKDPFINYKCKQVKTHRTFLSSEELTRLEKKGLPLERLEKVRDVFIFSCYTGLAYVDIQQLTEDNVVTGIDGKKWIYTFRQKTGNKSNIPLLPQALHIIQKYKNLIQFTSQILPIITNIKTNAYLKEIADLCGIKKNLTFHMARHTFATTVTLSNGVPIETVSNMLGHTKISTTQIYAKVLEHKVSKDMLALESKLLLKL